MVSLSVIEDEPQPLAEWIEPSLQDTAGRDPLGFNTITLDRILPQLIPGVLQLSERARYFSIYPWLLWQFAERKRPATTSELDHFIRRREFELCLAIKLCPHCDGRKAIGSDNASPRVSSGEDPLSRGLSIESPKGGFGLYYRSPLIDLGAVAPVGTPLGAEQEPSPIELLLDGNRATSLAYTFHDAIKDTEYYRRYERTDDPIPRPVLVELADRVCLCRLPNVPDERDAICQLLFSPPSDQDIPACEARRRAFALFLSLVDRDSDVAHSNGAFWRGLIERFMKDPAGGGSEGPTVAAWGALAMKECVQDALCSVWTDFCRAGIDEQPASVGLSPDALDGMTTILASRRLPPLGASTIDLAPDEPATKLQARLSEATREMDWNEVRAWAAEANTAAGGLCALLVFAARLPDVQAAHPLWTSVALRHSEHQDGLLGVLNLVNDRLSAGPTVAELMRWLVARFIVAPHEAIAYSKLPKATFRFCREETGRLRFFSPGSGGLERFRPSDDRRGTMASLSQDIGFLSPPADQGSAKLTSDGAAFVAAVFE
jgi:hypothetical protein